MTADINNRLYYVLHHDGKIYDSGILEMSERGKPDIIEQEGIYFIPQYEELVQPDRHRTHHYRSAYIRSLAFVDASGLSVGAAEEPRRVKISATPTVRRVEEEGKGKGKI